MSKPWTIEWRAVPGVEPRRGCLTCVYPEKLWTTYRHYKSEADRERAWEGFQTKKARWEQVYEIRRGYDGAQ
jgi:hypothetical protein